MAGTIEGKVREIESKKERDPRWQEKGKVRGIKREFRGNRKDREVR